MLPDGSLLKSFSEIYRERAEKQSIQIFLLARGICKKSFSAGYHPVSIVLEKKSVVEEYIRRNLLLSDKIAEWHFFCDNEDEYLRDRWR